MKYDVFISYSRNDFDEVSAFVKMLSERIPKLSLWFDILGVESGAEEFDEKIIKAIDDSSYVLFALSDNSIKSKWTKDEVLYAKNTGKNVIPVLLKDSELKGWFLFKFGRTDCIDSTSFIQVEKLTSDLSKWTLDARSERERKEREEQLRLAAEEKSRLERERKEREEQLRLATEEKFRLERERKEREEQLRLAAEEKSRLERERKEREEQLRLATEEKFRLERERKEREEQLRLAAEEKSRLERERKEREEQLRLAAEEKFRLERERKEREEQLRLATEEKSRLERERKEREEQLRLAAEEKSRLERERKEREEQLRLATEEKSRLERERKEREEQLRLAAEEKSRFERERKEREEQLRLAAEEKFRLERERKEREEQLRLAAEEKSRLERERKEREEQLRLVTEEKSRLERERKEREGQLRLAAEEKSRLERELRKIERRYNLDKERKGNDDGPAETDSSAVDYVSRNVKRTNGEWVDSSLINKKNAIKKYLYAVAVVLILVLAFFGRMFGIDDSITDEYREDSLSARQHYNNKEYLARIDIKMEAEPDVSKIHNLSGDTVPNMVDLGLSVKWAICNIGAIAPEDNGYFYAWGEVSTRSDYCSKSRILNGKKIYDISGYPKYDVASNLLGGYWRIPKMKEWQELIENCKWEWIANNGVVGYRVTSNKNGNSIFLPSTGFRSRTSHYYEGRYGYYWSSTPHEEDTYAAYGLKISDGVNDVGAFKRYYGFSVRPVCD